MAKRRFYVLEFRQAGRRQWDGEYVGVYYSKADAIADAPFHSYREGEWRVVRCERKDVVASSPRARVRGQ